MKKRVLSLGLALALCMGLVPAALAYSTPDFSDVSPTHWAYEAVMKMADAGVIKGVGGDRFAPEDKLTAEMFIVLVGRVVFPEVKAEGSDWSGPYVAEAKERGLLTGTNVTDETLKGEISRYDMAVILARCVELLKISTTKADTSKVTDYGDVPNRYTDAVLMVYGSGLIRGDQSGNFNGANSMTRQEAATVMDRLLGLKGNSSPAEATAPVSAAYSLKLIEEGKMEGVMVPGERTRIRCHPDPYREAPYDGFSLDRTGFGCTSSDPSVVEVAKADGQFWSVTAVNVGTATITITDPYGVSGSMDITVVAVRENVGTKAYPVKIRAAYYEEHTIRGDAYTKIITVPGVPYEIHFTRDGGKTSQVVYEGVSPTWASNGQQGRCFCRVELDKNTVPLSLAGIVQNFRCGQ